MRHSTDPFADRQATVSPTLSLGPVHIDPLKFFAADLTDKEMMDIGVWAISSLRASLGRGVPPPVPTAAHKICAEESITTTRPKRG